MDQHIDALTQLGDRFHLETFLEECMTADLPVALALLDVDRFLELNETLGRETGDRMLTAIAEVLKEMAALHVYRVSGDEFALAASGATLEDMFLRMESLRGSLEAVGAREAAGWKEVQPRTVSIGVAQYPRDHKEVQGLIKIAAAAMWGAKELGGNRVGLPQPEEMVMKSCYYSSARLRRLKLVAEKEARPESVLLREALDDLLKKYDR